MKIIYLRLDHFTVTKYWKKQNLSVPPLKNASQQAYFTSLLEIKLIKCITKLSFDMKQRELIDYKVNNADFHENLFFIKMQVNLCYLRLNKINLSC